MVTAIGGRNGLRTAASSLSNEGSQVKVLRSLRTALGEGVTASLLVDKSINSPLRSQPWFPSMKYFLSQTS
jgi:hypothetical protein